MQHSTATATDLIDRAHAARDAMGDLIVDLDQAAIDGSDGDAHGWGRIANDLLSGINDLLAEMQSANVENEMTANKPTPEEFVREEISNWLVSNGFSQRPTDDIVHEVIDLACDVDNLTPEELRDAGDPIPSLLNVIAGHCGLE